MIVKVCGITKEDQLNWLNDRGIDMVGFNFYTKSKRFVDNPLVPDTELLDIKRVGVFVNPGIDKIYRNIEVYQLDMVQLHGHESPQFCAEVASIIPVIKAFGIDKTFDFGKIKDYLGGVSTFLFDTKTASFGGSGVKFDWQKLNEYTLDKPFLLSGGISLTDIPVILNLKHKSFIGIDINSGFEVSPGIKNLEKIDEMMKLINR